MPKLYLSVLLLLFHIGIAGGQPPHRFKLYTSENGLFQKEVMKIMQDRKGQMWFATWDGLYKFDGYTFKNYKTMPGDGVELSSNRQEDLIEDRNGYIWLRGYDGFVSRYNPATENIENLSLNNYFAEEMFPSADGDLWIRAHGEQIIHIMTDSLTGNFKAERITDKGHGNAFYEDKNGMMWLLSSKGLYLYDKKRRQFHAVSDGIGCYSVVEAGRYLYFTRDLGRISIYTGKLPLKEVQLPTKYAVVDGDNMTDGRVVVGTQGDGLFVCSPQGKVEQHYSQENTPGMPSSVIKNLFTDSYNDIWCELATPGLMHLSPQRLLYDFFTATDNYGKPISVGDAKMKKIEDRNGQLWLSVGGANLTWYDRKKNMLVPFYDAVQQQGWTSENNLVEIYSDRQGNLWFCGKRTGLEKATFYSNDFHFIETGETEYMRDIRGLMQDSHGHIWVGNKDGEVIVYDSAYRLLGRLQHSGQVTTGSHDSFGRVYAFAEDDNGTIWIGTKGSGLIKATPTGKELTYKLDYYKHDDKQPFSLSDDNIFSLHVDRRQQLWIATFGGGLNCVDLKAALKGDIKFIHAGNLWKRYPIGQCNRVRFVTSDQKGRIWVGSTGGLVMCEGNLSKGKELEFHHFTRDSKNPHSLSYNDVHGICFTRKGEMYVATYGSGFNKLEQYDGKDDIRFRNYSMRDGLESDILLSVEEDRDGNVWFASETGLSKFTPSTGNMEVFASTAFQQRINFSEGMAVCAKNGDMLFPTYNYGVLYFSPKEIKASQFVPNIIFTSFIQEQQVVKPTAKGPLTTNIDNQQLISLPHDKNSFSIEFAALDMNDPETIKYAYRLKGFEDNWNYVGNQHMATYTNLPKGKYILEVRSTNSDGVWVDNLRTLDIEVKPSFWETPLAYLLYFVGFIALTMIATYIMTTIYRLKDKVKMEEQISDVKLNFFTDISHELRTPLTLIAGPVGQLMKSNTMNGKERQLLSLTDKNVKRMLQLVNQLLDFRKIQDKKMKMRVRQTNLVAEIQKVMDNFRTLADEHQINFRLKSEVEQLNIWTDTDKLENIIFNLLSNAFKYTPDGKTITVEIAEKPTEALFTVKDQGIGISREKQEKIFERFNNANEQDHSDKPSSGIGLSLVKELVALHHGSIRVESEPQQGSSFIVSLPKGTGHFGRDVEYILDDEVVKNFDDDHDDDHDYDNDYGDDKGEMQRLLIVEDNEELRFFLRQVFDGQMIVEEAANGLQALERCEQQQPDIIISDVMMPEMDGIDLLERLKNELSTCHIPVVLLTAKTNIESRIKGMDIGADDYITKPFSSDYLQARVQNLIRQRERLQAYYRHMLLEDVSAHESSTKPLSQKETPTAVLPADQRFMDGVINIIEQHLDDSNLKIDTLAQGIALSRTVFYNKFKSLTGLSPVDFIRQYRLKQALLKMEEEDTPISQIAYSVGFSDPRYFSTCFRQQFGMTPTEYKERKKASS